VTSEQGSRGPLADPRRRTFFKACTGTAALLLGTDAAARTRTTAHGGDSVFDVVIVGGGLSGLTSARDLKKAGNESFMVLEARDRVGGRTFNHQLGGGVISEGGGQWIGPGQTAVLDLARQLQIETFDTYYEGKTVFLAGDGRATKDLHGTFGTNPVLAAKLSKLARTVPCANPWLAPNAAELDKLSLGDWLSAQPGVTATDMLGWELSARLSNGTSTSKLGLLQYLARINAANSDFWQLSAIKNSSQQTRFVGGSQLISLKMAAELGDKVVLSCPVRRISRWDGDIVVVETDRGVYRARRVIMAISPPLCSQIAFDPPLPAGRAELQRRWPAYAPARKTVHVYPSPFWRKKGLNGQIIQANGPVMWAYDNSPPDGSVGVINAFVMQGWLPEKPARAEPILSRIYAQALGEEALHPTQNHDLDWGSADSWTLSCVSPIPPGFWTQFGPYLRPPAGRLIWSGTETAEIWPCNMDGAVRSGHRAALQALNALASHKVGTAS
jgi:monoamine oxidase